MMKKRIRQSLKILAGLALVFLVYAFFFILPFESTDDAYLESHVVAVSAQVTGHVTKVLVTDNQVVKAGEVLAEVDARDYTAAEAQAKADYTAAAANAKKAVSDVTRYQPLLARREISEQVYEHAVLLQEQTQAEAASKKAAWQLAELNLTHTKITAPFAGRVTRKSVEVGTHLQVGQPILALVSPELWVVANFKETQITNMQPGQKATITIDSHGQQQFKAHVDSLQMGAGSRFSMFPPENASGNFVKVVQRVPVKIIFDEALPSGATFGPGFSVVAKVRTK